MSNYALGLGLKLIFFPYGSKDESNFMAPKISQIRGHSLVVYLMKLKFYHAPFLYSSPTRQTTNKQSNGRQTYVDINFEFFVLGYRDFKCVWLKINQNIRVEMVLVYIDEQTIPNHIRKHD